MIVVTEPVAKGAHHGLGDLEALAVHLAATLATSISNDRAAAP
jgi:hypothetical protein